MIRRTLSLFLSLSIGSIVAFGQELSFSAMDLSERGRTAFSSLRTAKLYAIGGVGYSGLITEGEKALDVLIEEPAATSALKALVSDASLEGGLYGLFGLRMLNCECFDAEVRKYRQKVVEAHEARLNVASGCLQFRTKTEKEKIQVIDGLLGNGFDQEARMKECRRQTNGRPQDRQKCQSEVVNNK